MGRRSQIVVPLRGSEHSNSYRQHTLPLVHRSCRSCARSFVPQSSHPRGIAGPPHIRHHPTKDARGLVRACLRNRTSRTARQSSQRHPVHNLAGRQMGWSPLAAARYMRIACPVWFRPAECVPRLGRPGLMGHRDSIVSPRPICSGNRAAAHEVAVVHRKDDAGSPIDERERVTDDRRHHKPYLSSMYCGCVGCT